MVYVFARKPYRQNLWSRLKLAMAGVSGVLMAANSGIFAATMLQIPLTFGPHSSTLVLPDPTAVAPRWARLRCNRRRHATWPSSRRHATTRRPPSPSTDLGCVLCAASQFVMFIVLGIGKT